MITISSPSAWARLLVGLLLVFGIFHWLALGLGSDKGQAGIAVCAAVLAALFVVERLFFGQSPAETLRSLGLRPGTLQGLMAAGIVCVALLLVVPLYLMATDAAANMLAGWVALVPGLFAQSGIAEETLFRGYLFGRLRRGRSFWRAAWLSLIPFAAAHLLLFLTMPWPVALAALLLAVIVSMPLAHLFELGGSTIWGAALLHFVVQSVVKVVVISGDQATVFPLIWMAASAVLPLFVLLAPAGKTPASAGTPRGPTMR